jgi:hypothetical protein
LPTPAGITHVNWTPDGNRIIYTHVQEIVIAEADGSDPQKVACNGACPLVIDEGAVFGADLSTNGVIVFSRWSGGTWDLWLVKEDGSHTKQITSHRSRNTASAAWGPPWP